MASIAVASRHLARGARFVVPLALTAGCLWLVRQQVGDDMPAALPASLSGIGAVNILLALGCVAIGFWAVGRYDGLSHRHFGTRVPPRVARPCWPVVARFMKVMKNMNLPQSGLREIGREPRAEYT